jgi:hypothetical protein
MVSHQVDRPASSRNECSHFHLLVAYDDTRNISFIGCENTGIVMVLETLTTKTLCDTVHSDVTTNMHVYSLF